MNLVHALTRPHHSSHGLLRARRPNMPSRTTIFAVTAVLLALLFSPQLASEARSDGCLTVASPEFVKQKASPHSTRSNQRQFNMFKIFEYDFVRQVHGSTGGGSLDALRLKRNGDFLPALMAKPDEYLELTPPNGKDGTRTARVIKNTSSKFIYREDHRLGQRIVHTVRIKPSGKHTIVQYDKTWKGAFIMLPLRWMNLFQEGMSTGGASGGLEEMRRALNQAWEAK